MRWGGCLLLRRGRSASISVVTKAGKTGDPAGHTDPQSAPRATFSAGKRAMDGVAGHISSAPLSVKVSAVRGNLPGSDTAPAVGRSLSAAGFHARQQPGASRTRGLAPGD